MVVVKLLLILIIVVALAVAMYVYYSPAQLATLETEPKAQLYQTQAACESATQKKCAYTWCDFVPEGKTFEEVCGITGKGWAPVAN
jgi:hypothetical protein